MKKSHLLGMVCAGVISFITMSSHAALFGRLETPPDSGNYLAYYDDQLKITLTANADLNGKKNWKTASDWVAGLTIGGVSGWRLPSADVDGDGHVVDCSVSGVTDCADNEMGFLYWEEGITTAAPSPFSDVRIGLYWSSETGGTAAWVFNFEDGIQEFRSRSNWFYAWAVRDGDIITDVNIDIKPGSDPNCFNINGHGVIPVAILGSGDFNVYDIKLESLSFGGLEVRVRGNKGPLCSIEYSNVDEYPDLVCHFEDNASYWEPGVGDATLTGKMIDGTSFKGTDSICIVPLSTSSSNKNKRRP